MRLAGHLLSELSTRCSSLAPTMRMRQINVAKMSACVQGKLRQQRKDIRKYRESHLNILFPLPEAANQLRACLHIVRNSRLLLCPLHSIRTLMESQTLG